MALKNVTFDFKAGGYPLPTYKGSASFTMNVSPDDTSDTIKGNAVRRAKREVSERLCMSILSIDIDNLVIENV